MIAAIVLAAGLSRRMGEPKLLLPVQGRPVLRHVAERVLIAGLDPVMVVTGREHKGLARALETLRVTLVVNTDPDAGQASSIRVGIAALPDETEAALIVLGDQPFLRDEIIPALLAARRRTGKPIIAPRYRDGRGNPVLFSRDIFPELLGLEGDQGARAVVGQNAGRVALVDFEFPMPSDLDTPEDYDRLRSGPDTR